MTVATPGIHHDRVTAWLAARVPALDEPLHFALITGGHSNLTYTVTDAAGRQWVLRRPPLHQVLATAHDMVREHTIIAALEASPVPVPTSPGLCTDETVNEAPFYVMDHVDGIVVRNRSIALTLPEATRRRASTALVEALAAIHRVDPDTVGLGELGRRDDYVGRQLRRWLRQYEESKTRDRPLVRALHDALAARIPAQGPAAIVHGDFRLDNCIISPDGEILAVLDWELCTLGDPLVDLAQLLVYWAEPDDTVVPLDEPPSTAPGFASRAELADAYSAATGSDLSSLGFYRAFASWRLACILEGVYSRYVNGAMADVPADLDAFVGRIDALLALAEGHLDD